MVMACYAASTVGHYHTVPTVGRYQIQDGEEYLYSIFIVSVTFPRPLPQLQFFSFKSSRNSSIPLSLSLRDNLK